VPIRRLSYPGPIPALSASDYERALDVLGEAAAVEGPTPFPEPVLDSLRRFVPCDVVSYHEQPLGVPAIAFTGERRGDWTLEIVEAEACYWHQDHLRPADGARMLSDFLSPREYHRLELYQEAGAPLGVEYMMRLWLDPRGDRGARLEFDRQSRDFEERDRAKLDLILPYLKQFRRNAATRRRGTAADTRAPVEVTPREREVLELVAEGKTNDEVARILWISPGTVRKHLENSYETLGVHSRTAAVALLFAPLSASVEDRKQGMPA
jgi:DNA-binding CsgD family transcriptional regulator